jgi:hypothetical protein
LYAKFSDPHCFGAILHLEATRLKKNGANLMKENCLSFQKIYQKNQISFSFFDKKIAIEILIECFLQNLTKNHEICEA